MFSSDALSPNLMMTPRRGSLVGAVVVLSHLADRVRRNRLIRPRPAQISGWASGGC